VWNPVNGRGSGPVLLASTPDGDLKSTRSS